jgi:hypothetical protein
VGDVVAFPKPPPGPRCRVARAIPLGHRQWATERVAKPGVMGTVLAVYDGSGAGAKRIRALIMLDGINGQYDVDRSSIEVLP